ncbi:hypothetical protein E3P92_02200 [Wallemia ichthyophaga]|uniref:Aspartate-semialdehyde dehydrogenase n=1 Tax=Wallemia ichthyophaga TaxID=245174 RepID=A0A4T0EEC7_WALIC|nr:hypothetical protein E3P91_01951 [Wallemia ichthyophaga]TIA96592.1 hypothetical protein E3P96_03575 [Wallemia ichthyophaga]TIB10528.1 hypothetical protein E3P90_02797 [Wallemia ichthyophaga]TIB10615.1 hypothetical protein E3P93_02805 [Wallemia ichthyophaga]TIB13657.1 hypothetical protein E3P92_02200 [Wallemia ichthyophaga]
MLKGEYKVGVLGATGTVGQRFILHLHNHPFFKLVALGASSRSAGKAYRDVTKWKQVKQIPESVQRMQVEECTVEHFQQCDIVFSGLDHDVAGPIEDALRKAHVAVFSNAKNYRRDPLVPLVVPLINTSHYSVLPAQQKSLGLTKGYIVANANCSTTALVVPLAALEKAFGPLEQVQATTLQAISGSGYPGLPSLDILDNVVPYIGSEEDKMEWETYKILGGVSAQNDAFDYHAQSPLTVSATCNRVPVIDGHTVCAGVKFASKVKPSPQQVMEALSAYTCDAQHVGAPSAPQQVITVHQEQDRPQPRLDRDHQNGAGVNVGRVRGDALFDIKFVVLANNVQIGAATSSVMNAEVAALQGYV